MKKVHSLLVFCCICFNIQAQVSKSNRLADDARYIPKDKLQDHSRAFSFEQINQKKSLPYNTPLSAGCVNLGFDDNNDFTGWTGYLGNNQNSNAPLTIAMGPTTPASSPVVINTGQYSCDYFSIINTATMPTDPLCGFSLISPLGGKVAKMGGQDRNLGGTLANNAPCDPTQSNSSNNTAGEVLERKFVVNQSNTEFQYCFAFVYNDDGTHINGEQPYFKVEVLDQNGNPISCLNYYQQGNDGVAPTGYDSIIYPGSSDPKDKIYFTNGYKVSSLNLLPYLTQTVTVRFTVTGCIQTAHFGYAYVDCTCAPMELIIPQNACIGGAANLIAPIQSDGTYAWTGPGIVSGSTAQTAVVNQNGLYSVTITNSNGCKYTLDTNVVFYPNPVLTVNSPTISCLGGMTATLTATSNGAGPITYNWVPSAGISFTNAGDSSGTVSPGANATYSVIGTSAHGCKDTVVAHVTLNAGTEPPPTFLIDTVCLGTATQFTNTTVGASNTYTWTFGDGNGSLSAQPNLSHTYATAGSFPVTLVVAVGSCTATATKTAIVNTFPKLSFTADHPCNGTAMHISNTTANPASITTWSWTLGDGGTDGGPNPAAHNYSTAGCYSVVLTATASTGCSGMHDTLVYIHPNPVAAFSASTVCIGSPSAFTDASTVTNPACLNDQITSWNWDFGDGKQSTNTTKPGNFTHTYATCGAYNITLTVTTTNACVSTFTVSGDTVYCLPVVTTPPSVTVCPNTAVPTQSFISTVTNGGPAHANWTLSSNNSGAPANSGTDVVNGYTSKAQNLTCNNLVDTVKAQVVSAAGCMGNKVFYTITLYPTPVLTAMKNDTICANATLSVPGFAACPANSSIAWTNSNTGIGLGVSGNGNIGTFTGKDTTDQLNIGNIQATPTANGCPGIPGNFAIVIKPIPVITSVSSTTVCPNFGTQTNNSISIALTADPGNSSISWSNSNTNIGLAATGTGVPTPYPAPHNTTYMPIIGYITYIPSLNGCVGLPKKDTVEIKPTPFLNSIPNQYLCPNQSTSPVNFSIMPATTGTAVVYNWSYNAIGQVTGTTNPFPKIGPIPNAGNTTLVYQVTVYPTLNGCDGPDSVFTISVYPNPVANFSYTSKICLGQFTSFTDLSTCGNNIPITQWNWNFGNGQSSGNQNPNTTFTSSGYQTVLLTVTSNPNPLPVLGGCTDTISKQPFVNPIPVANFVGDSLKSCPDLKTIFNGSLSSVATPCSIISYTWNFGNGQSSNLANPPQQTYTNTSPIQPAFYSVSLMVASDSGCVSPKATKANYVEVYPKPIADFTWGPESADIDDSKIDFFNKSQGASEYLPSKTYGPNGVQYYLGDVFATIPSENDVFTNQNFFHVYEHYDPYTYYVTQWVINQYGCKDEITKPVEIQPDFTFYIPNAFSPDGNGVNEGFKGTGIGIDLTTYNLWVFDRWGLMIFYSDDLERTWDGHMHGNDDKPVLQQDVYVWKVKFNDFRGKKHEYHGTVTLLK